MIVAYQLKYSCQYAPLLVNFAIVVSVGGPHRTDSSQEEKGRGAEEKRGFGEPCTQFKVHREVVLFQRFCFFLYGEFCPLFGGSLSECLSLQERQREMTLQRRRSRLKLEASAAASGTATPTGRYSVEFPENTEFDELISSLKTGDYFARRRTRGGGGGGGGNPGGVASRRRLEFSRERPASAIELVGTQLQEEKHA